MQKKLLQFWQKAPLTPILHKPKERSLRLQGNRFFKTKFEALFGNMHCIECMKQVKLHKNENECEAAFWKQFDWIIIVHKETSPSQ
jgi:hypothetical protein